MSAFPSNVSTRESASLLPLRPFDSGTPHCSGERFCDPVVVVARRSFAACRAEWAPCVRPAAETVTESSCQKQLSHGIGPPPLFPWAGCLLSRAVPKMGLGTAHWKPTTYA